MENLILEALVKESGWNMAFTKKQVEYYEDFMISASLNNELIPPPSSNVDLVWHVHMLHPKFYYDYCHTKFGKIIEHELPTLQTSQNDKDLYSIVTNQGNQIKQMASAGCNSPAKS